MVIAILNQTLHINAIYVKKNNYINIRVNIFHEQGVRLLKLIGKKQKTDLVKW